MTGIERLRKLSEDMLNLSLWVRLTTGTEKDWDCCQGDGRTVNNELLSIADQIEREHTEELGHHVGDLTTENAELRKRLMPEGMEWPRYEDGKPFIPGDGGSVEFFGDGIFNVWINGDHQHLARGERVKRPAVLAADGEPLEVGQTVWRITDGTSATVERLNGATGFIDSDGTPFEARYFTHQRPVLDADGVPIELGDDLYIVEGSLKFHVSHVDRANGKIATDAMFAIDKWADPSMFTHRAPVLAADGRPLRVGETVWLTDGRERHVVLSTEEDGIGSIVTEVQAPGAVKVHISPSRLTHERPDSWERLEEDADKNPFDYCKDVGHRLDTCENSEAYKARDLVRRCKELARKENNNE